MYCSSCGTSLPPEAKFCVQCGARIVPAAEGAAATGTPASREPARAPTVVSPAADPKKVVPAAGGKNKILGNIAGILLVGIILFAIVASIVRIFSLSTSAIQGHIGPEHLFLVFVAGLAIYWMVNRAKKN